MELRKLYVASNVDELYQKAFDEAVHQEDIRNPLLSKFWLGYLLQRAQEEEITERDEEEAYLLYVRSLRMLRHTNLHEVAAAVSFNEVNLIKKLEELHEKLKGRYEERNELPQVTTKVEMHKAPEVESKCVLTEKQEDLNINGGDMTSLASKEEVLRILECPICVSIPPGPIYSCVNGHIICGTCRPKTTICAICRGTYSTSRNLIAEKIIEASKFACEFREQGCGLSLTGDKMVKHRSECSFRPIPCFYEGSGNCDGSDIPYRDYKYHLSTVHHRKNLKIEDGKFTGTYFLREDSFKDDFTWGGGGYALFDGKVFFTRTLCDDQHAHFSLSVLGSEMDAAKYKVRIKLIFDNPITPAANRYFEVTMAVVPHSTTDDEIEKSWHVVLDRTSLLRSANVTITSNRTLKYTWKLSYEIIKNQ